MARPTPNFVILDGSLPDVGRLVAAMLKARDAVDSRSWSHPQEPTCSPTHARERRGAAKIGGMDRQTLRDWAQLIFSAYFRAVSGRP